MNVSDYAIDGDEAIPALHSPIVWPLIGDEPGLVFGWQEMPAELRASKRCISFLPGQGKESRPIKIMLLRRCEPLYMRSLDPRTRLEFAFEGRGETAEAPIGRLAYVLPGKPLVLASSTEDLIEALEHAQRLPEPRRVTLIANPWMERVDLARLRFGFSSLDVVDPSPRVRGGTQTLRLPPRVQGESAAAISIANKRGAALLLEDESGAEIGRIEPGASVLADFGAGQPMLLEV